MTTPPVPRRSRALLVAGAVLMVAAVVITFIGIAGVVDTSINAVDAPRITVPGEAKLPFESGGYAVYAPKPDAGAPTIDDIRLGDITVTAPDGAAVAVSTIDSKLVVSDGDVQWAAVGQFVVDQPGDYLVRIGPPADTTVLIAPTIAEVGTRSVVWVLPVGARVRGLHRRRGPHVHRRRPPRRRRRPRPRRPLRPPRPRPSSPSDN